MDAANVMSNVSNVARFALPDQALALKREELGMKTQTLALQKQKAGREELSAFADIDRAERDREMHAMQMAKLQRGLK